MLAGATWIAGAAMKATQAEMAMGGERPHAARFGERQRCLVVSGGTFGIEVIRMNCQIAENASCVSYEAWLALRGFNRTICQTPRLLKPTEQEAAASYRVIAPATMNKNSLVLLTSKVFFTLSQATQRLTDVANLRQRPG